MADKEPWDLLRENLNRFAGGDVEWVEDESTGETYRGRIKTFSLTESGKRLQIVFAWCATFLITNQEGWRFTDARSMISLSKEKTKEVTEGKNFQIEFVSEGKRGTFFPRTQGLLVSKVNGLGPKAGLRVVK